MRPLSLQPALHPGQHPRRATGGGVHQEMVLSQSHRHTIVKHHAVFVEHEAVAAFAHFQLGPGVAVQPVEQHGGVRPLNVNLAQRRCIQRADTAAHRQHLACHGGVQVFAAFRVVPGPFPLSDILKQGAMAGMPVMDGGGADRVKQVAQFMARHQAERDRCVVGPEGGGADLGDGAA